MIFQAEFLRCNKISEKTPGGTEPQYPIKYHIYFETNPNIFDYSCLYQFEYNIQLKYSTINTIGSFYFCGQVSA